MNIDKKIMSSFVASMIFCYVVMAEQQPIFFLDFEKESKIKIDSDGIGGRNCWDVSQASLIPYYENNNLKSAFQNVKSFTVTGWFKSPVNFENLQHQTILNLPDCLNIFSQGLYKGLIEIELMSSFNPDHKYAVSSWYSPYFADDKWVYFAVSYDAKKENDNVCFYVGTEKSIVELESKTTFYSDVNNWKFDSFTFQPSDANISDSNGLFIGALTTGGKNKFQGKLDQIRIYASTTDNSAALNMTDIENIRRKDLGNKWLDEIAINEAKTELDQKQRLWQLEEKHWNDDFNVHQIDPFDRIFSDQPPMPTIDYVGHYPGNSKAIFLFAIHSSDASRCIINPTSVKNKKNHEIKWPVRTYELRYVPIESNNNGGIRTSLVSKPPALWQDNLIRKAPFFANEIMVETNNLAMRKNQYSAVLVEVDIPQEASSGQYHGCIEFKVDEKSTKMSYNFKVYDVQLSDKYALNSTHWLWPEPQNLTNANIPQWWSDEHWRLLRNSGRVLREFGQTAIFTPLFNFENPLIETTLKADGNFEFNFEKFDKWCEIFIDLGFKNIEGMHTGHVHGNVYVLNEETKKKELFWDNKGDRGIWLGFVKTFYQALYPHLEQKGWTDKYLQHQLDEAHDPEYYKQLSGLAKKYMPKVRTIDAMNNSPQTYFPICDIPVPAISVVLYGKNFVQQHKQKGKDIWMYHCCSPYPPFANRHLDEDIVCSRLYPVFCYMYGVDGYLWWAANIYRGADPYKTSLGPIPNGSQNPGHGPGDNWMFYPTKDGLIGSMRMAAFREGLIDYSLLKILSEKNASKADELVKRVAQSPIKWSKKTQDYNLFRKLLLTELENTLSD